jgi:hypothetical protein
MSPAQRAAEVARLAAQPIGLENASPEDEGGFTEKDLPPERERSDEEEIRAFAKRIR